ncbi:uncharacterized protein LOC131950205 [Physella acuta]|uniref:uncharacterized protein LOC131950205 n=1 Tax=Physella acuta TaxID=109671 RepID=UPI0027DDF411|nr:uncharacterized protein LOC131950205 [Physella acuta]
MLSHLIMLVLLLVSFSQSMYIGQPFGMMDSYDAPDQKILRRDAFGRIQSFDVSHERRIVPNAFGGLSQYNVMELSDPDIHYPGPQFIPVGGRFGGVVPPPFPRPYHHSFHPF